MGFYTDDWTLRHEQTREGEIYREKERLQQELEDTRARQRREDYTREQDEYRAERQRRAEREERGEMIDNLYYELEHLKLCRKFGIEEVEKP